MIFVLLLNVFLLAAAIINCGGKKKNDFPQPQPTQPAPVASAKKEEGSKEPEKSADKPKEDEAKKAEGGEKKADADNKIADAIKKGDMLPANDNETLNDCESNWGAGVAGKS